MGTDIIAILLIWIAIRVESKKKEDTGSSLDNFGWLGLQAILCGIALILAKLNPVL